MARHYLELKEQLFVSKTRLRDIFRVNELTDCLTDQCDTK